MEILQALREVGVRTPLDSARRIIVFIVNRCLAPDELGRVRNPPSTVNVLPKAAGTPIDVFPYEAVELVKDTAARWQTMRLIGDSAAIKPTATKQLRKRYASATLKIYAIDVSFPALKDKAELDYLNQQPTSFVLPAEAVDRLRAAAGTIIMDSPEFKRLLKDVGADVVAQPPATGNPATAH